MVKNLPTMREAWAQSLGWEDPLEESMANHSSYFYLRKTHEQRSLAGYSPQDCKESDMTEEVSTSQHSPCARHKSS